MFTAHDFDDGLQFILETLKEENIYASFFFTGDYIKNNKSMVKNVISSGHSVGPHSDQHLLYCDWVDRDLLLFSEKAIKKDVKRNVAKLKRIGSNPVYFMPPYEWYNKIVAKISENLNLILVNFSPGTSSNADYTTPAMSNYKSSEEIYNQILLVEETAGLNGFHLLIHAGTHPERTDKLYFRLPILIQSLKSRGYQFSKL